MNLLEERTVALAGVMQACSQVQMLARKGEFDSSVFDASQQSILVLDAVNTPAVFGGITGVMTGLRLLSNGMLSSAKIEDVELLRYAMSILHLQTQLYRNRNVYDEFAANIERLSAVSGDEQIIACSDLYQKYISDLRPQIIVQGEQDYLQREEIPSKIRTMLLAAFRSAVLWQQKGGSKFKIMWERTRMRNASQSLLSDYKLH